MHTNRETSTSLRADGIDRLIAEGVPLCQIEEMLDQLEYEEACAAVPHGTGLGLFGHLMWS